VPRFGDQHLVLELDREVAALGADQRLDAEDHAGLQRGLEGAVDPAVGVGDEGPFVAEADAVHLAGILLPPVAVVQLVAAEGQLADRDAGAQHRHVGRAMWSIAWCMALTMAFVGRASPIHQVRLMSTQMP
jgi:hypothetical protein